MRAPETYHCFSQRVDLVRIFVFLVCVFLRLRVRRLIFVLSRATKQITSSSRSPYAIYYYHFVQLVESTQHGVCVCVCDDFMWIITLCSFTTTKDFSFFDFIFLYLCVRVTVVRDVCVCRTTLFRSFFRESFILFCSQYSIFIVVALHHKCRSQWSSCCA